MEGTYAIESYPYVSKKLNCWSYFLEYTNLLKETLYSNQDVLERLITDEEKVASQLGIDIDEYHHFEELCGLSLLERDPLEINEKQKPEDSKGILDRATRTLATAVELKSLKAYELKYENKLRDLKRTAIPQFEQEPNPSPVARVPDNYVVTARVFRPFKSNTGLNPVPHVQDVMMLGSQNLTDFRDTISCINEGVMVVDDLGPIKDHITSSAFFFGNTFYSDCRSVTNVDYGVVIDKWAKDNPGMHLGPFEQKKMEDFTIGDLEIRLGFPYVFMHLGNCEHLITFVDARLMVPEDLQNPDEYPLVVESDTNLLMYCGACVVNDSSHYVDDDKMPTKPMKLCEQCFYTFYKKNNIVPPSTEDVYYRKLPGKQSVNVQPQEEMECED